MLDKIFNDALLTRDYFNNLADCWETVQTTEIQKIERLISRLELNQAQKILDIGCGTGILFPLLKKLTQPRTNIFAIDSAENMIQHASLEYNGKIKVLCGDVQFLPFPENLFDSIIAFHVFPHINDKKQAIKECWRILKPGGQLAIIHLHGSEEINTFHASLNSVVSDHKLPSAEHLGHFLQKLNFDVSHCNDYVDEYFVCGRKNGLN